MSTPNPTEVNKAILEILNLECQGILSLNIKLRVAEYPTVFIKSRIRGEVKHTTAKLKLEEIKK